MTTHMLTQVWRPVVLSVLLLASNAATAQTSAGDSSALKTLSASRTGSGASKTQLPDGTWLWIGGAGERGLIQSPASALASAKRLTSQLSQARTDHTATLLPDGGVWIFGGVAPDGAVLASAETFDPAAGTLSALEAPGLLARSGHTATLLTNGRVMIAGGVDARGEPIREAELYNPKNRQVEHFSGPLDTARLTHLAQLLPNDGVLLWGGVDRSRAALPNGEQFDQSTQRFNLVSRQQAEQLLAKGTALPSVAAIHPGSDAVDVPVEQIIAVRFAHPMDVTSLNPLTVTLLGPGGVTVAVKPVPTENGMLLFLTPGQQLLPSSRYTLFIQGARDGAGKALPFFASGFDTARLAAVPGSAAAERPHGVAISTPDRARPASPAPHANPAVAVGVVPSEEDGEEWYPDASNLSGDWRTRRGTVALQTAAQLKSLAGETALSGQVLKLNGKPLPNISVRIGNRTATTDSRGRFTLRGLAGGTHTMAIDGGAKYGYYKVLISAKEGQTTSLHYPIWLSRLDPAGTVAISSPTQQATVLTSPRIPGLELHIPPGTVIRDHDGKIVTELNMTAIPTDRPPFPIPNVGVPVYFTIQPGGAVIQSTTGGKQLGARLIYPNFAGAAPGSRIDFWNYSAHEKGWYVYGQGTVSKDGKQVVPDAGVVVYEFSGAMISSPSNAPFDCPPFGGCKGGDPVDLYTGLFLNEAVDLAIEDVMPLEVRRSYRPRDTASRAFGIGTNLSYDMFLVGDTSPWTFQDLILPDGGRIHFPRTSPGTSYGDAVYTHTATQGFYHGAVLKRGTGACYWQLATKNGGEICFPSSYLSKNARAAAAISMRDGNGNTLNFGRDSAGNLLRVSAPNGRALSFSYDNLNRITQARDDLGRTVAYAYDDRGRLSDVTDPAGKMQTFTYDTFDRMLTVKDARGNLMVTNQYDANGRVEKQTYADGKTNLFTYVLDANSKVQQTKVTNGRGFVTQYVFNSSGYPTSVTAALGQPEQQKTTYERNSSNQILSKTDQLGRKTVNTFDDRGNTLTVTQMSGTPSATTVVMTYKPLLNEVETATDALGHQSRFVYDEKGRMTSSIDANGNERLIEYDAVGRAVKYTDGAGNSTRYTFDGADLIRETDPLGRSTESVFDAVGRVVGIVDARGRQGAIAYDKLDRITQVTDASGKATTYEYDANGNKTQVKDAKANLHNFVADTRNALSSNTDPLNRNTGFTYDANHNLSTLTNRKGEVTRFAYDALDRVTTVTYADNSTVKFTYDAGNRMKTAVDSLAGTITRTYNGLDLLETETTSKGSVSYTYYANGLRKTMTVSGQPTLTYSYDNGDRLVRIDQAAGASNNNLAQWIGFSYDKADRRTQTRLPNGTTVNYTFDNSSQLLAITYNKSDGTVIGDLKYGYDLAGLRVSAGGSMATTRLADATTGGTVNAASELTGWDGQTLTYDNDGNLTSDGSLRYVWNARGQLKEVRTLAGALLNQYSYDAFGRRQSKSIDGVGSGYVYDGDNIVQELSGATANNSVPANVRANYLTGGIDEMFAQLTGVGSSAKVASYLTDGLGSVIRITDGVAGKLVDYTYDAYGNTIADAVVNNPFQYTGRENDQNGLYFYRARYYSPKLKRFISSDPIGLEGGINTYGYVDGDPLSKVDPSGKLGIVGGLVGGLGDLGYQLYKNGGNFNCVNWWEVGSWALSGSGAGIIGRRGLTGMKEFFWNTNRFKKVSRDYWGARGGAGTMSLDHWAVSQAAGRSGAVHEGIVNAGFNLVEMPMSWNYFLGFASRWGGSRAAKAQAGRVGVQVGIPGVAGAAGYAGYEIGRRAQECGCQ